jgi:hypothetical protein
MNDPIKHTRFWIVLCCIAGMVSCTADFDEINISPTAVQEDRIDEDLLFTRSLVYGALRYTEFQRAQHLYANHYIQYYAMSVDRFETGRYITRNDWLTDYWQAAYADFGMQCQQVINIAGKEDRKANKVAMARIWKVFIMHRITDFWGDVPYFEAFSGDITPAYDPQSAIYTDMLEELEDAVNSFSTAADDTFGPADVIYQGDVESWIRFANALRLRLAMRVSNADPGLAEQHVREVLEDGRLISDNTQNAVMPYGRDFGNADENIQPMSLIRSFNEYRVSNTLVDFLSEHNDPRLPLYIEPVESGEYVGLQNGLNPAEVNDLNPNNFSRESQLISNPYAPSILLSHAEVQFLRAEAALKGWDNSGSAQDYYEAGVRSSINFWLDVRESLRSRVPESEAGAIPDTVITSATIEAYLEEPGVQFDPDRALEQIITQKWLANINQGFEAYADYRRTGFPALNPIPNTDGASETGGTEVPRRIRYPIEEQALNRANYEAAIARQGPDLPTTRMWWDQ